MTPTELIGYGALLLIVTLAAFRGLNKYAPALMGNQFPEREAREERERLLSEEVAALARKYKYLDEDTKRRITNLEITIDVLTGALKEAQKLMGEQDNRIETMQREMGAMEKELAVLRARQPAPLPTAAVEPVTESALLVAVGSDAALKIDLTALRAVRTETGLGFTRIEDATIDRIKQHLDRARINGRPIDKLHLAVHSGPKGILLGGTLVDSVEFSEILDGVRVLLLAGCEGDSVGDYLGVVNYVVTMTEKVSNADASLFTRAFWTQIGLKKEPVEAFNQALKRSPSGMSEFVERHF